MQQLEKCPICHSTNSKKYIQTEAQMHPSDEKFNFDQCENCQLVFLNPRVEPEDLMNYYTEYYLPYRGSKAWGKYERFVEGSQTSLDAKRTKLVQKFHKISHGSTILDVGCGKPTFLKRCKDSLKCKTFGIDFSDEGWLAKNGEFEGIDLMVGEVKDIPAFLRPDVITMWHYLEHDYTPLENLKSLRQLAHNDTTLIIEVPNVESESREKYGKNWAGWHTPRHTSLFSPESINTLLKNSGWQSVEILTYGTLDPYILYWMSEMEQKGIAWDKNMETEFINFTKGMISFLPKKWSEKKRSLGVLTAIAKPA